MAEITIKGFRCERCDYAWAPRKQGVVPVICPTCKTPYWNRPRKAKQEADKAS